MLAPCFNFGSFWHKEGTNKTCRPCDKLGRFKHTSQLPIDLADYRGALGFKLKLCQWFVMSTPKLTPCSNYTCFLLWSTVFSQVTLPDLDAGLDNLLEPATVLGETARCVHVPSKKLAWNGMSWPWIKEPISALCKNMRYTNRCHVALKQE